jgi:hypothetical protein
VDTGKKTVLDWGSADNDSSFWMILGYIIAMLILRVCVSFASQQLGAY